MCVIIGMSAAAPILHSIWKNRCRQPKTEALWRASAGRVFYLLACGFVLFATCAKLDAATALSNAFSFNQQLLHLQFFAFVVFFAVIHNRNRSMMNVSLHLVHCHCPLLFSLFGPVWQPVHVLFPGATLDHC